MAIEATELWSARRLTKAANNRWSARRAFDIINANSETDCFTATILGGSTLVPITNEAHPDQSRLKVRSRPCQRIGFKMYRLTIEYEIPDDGSGFDDGEDDVLDQPIRFAWEPGTEIIETQFDKNDNPIVNSAREPFSPPAQKKVNTIHLIIRRWEPFFDIQLQLLYMNKVNSEQLSVPGLGSVLAGQAFCEFIAPTHSFAADANAVLVEYRFEFREDGFAFAPWTRDFRPTINCPAIILTNSGWDISSPKAATSLQNKYYWTVRAGS